MVARVELITCSSHWCYKASHTHRLFKIRRQVTQVKVSRILILLQGIGWYMGDGICCDAVSIIMLTARRSQTVCMLTAQTGDCVYANS